MARKKRKNLKNPPLKKKQCSVPGIDGFFLKNSVIQQYILEVSS
jgi:hypothetical protein